MLIDANHPRVETLHWDGRLDNRADLLLRLRDSLQGQTTNAAIACAAYERWGVQGFVQLIGDWSLVLRDHRNRATVLASDFAGVRPLYYHMQHGRVRWSNRLQQLAIDASDLDEQYVAGFLMYGGCPNRTPYRGIYSVPPGHAVVVSTNETKIERFWSMPIGDAIHYRNEHRYEEEVRVLFREALVGRLQADSPVLAELSGGLDSSSVTCVATDLLRRRTVPAKQLTGVSFVWPNSLDEPFIREVESHCDIDGVQFSTHKVPIVSERKVGQSRPEAFEPFRTAIAEIAKQLNAKTVLTGQAGDLLLGNWFDDSLQIAGRLRDFRLRHACAEALAWSKLLRLPIYRILWRGVQAALPFTWSPAEIYTATDGSFTPRNIETSLSTGFCDRTAILESENYVSSSWKSAPPERRKHFRTLTTMLELRQLQVPEPLQHLDYTHPFAHRPLVEYLMSVPAQILCRPGEPRRLMRLAFADFWPLKLRERRSKGVFNIPWQTALRPLAHSLLEAKQLHVVERGYVHFESVRSRLERLCHGLDCNEYQLRQIILLELWLRNRAADATHLVRAAA